MAALYQIAQSDPPQLLTENKWSDKLVDLVSSMLQKEPEMRPTPQQALQHDYFTGAEDKPDIIGMGQLFVKYLGSTIFLIS